VHGSQHPPDQDCAAFSLAELQNEREKASAAFINRISKPCPRCNAKIEKTSGCNHMTCRECHCDWCWLCGQDISVNGVTEHFSTTTADSNPSPCAGLQFLLVDGYERMPDDDPELAAELQAWVARRHQEQQRAQRPGERVDDRNDRCRRFCCDLAYTVFCVSVYCLFCCFAFVLGVPLMLVGLAIGVPVQLLLICSLPLQIRSRSEQEMHRIDAYYFYRNDSTRQRLVTQTQGWERSAEDQLIEFPRVAAKWTLSQTTLDAVDEWLGDEDRWFRKREFIREPLSPRGARTTLCETVCGYVGFSLALALDFASLPSLSILRCFWECHDCD
jgi:hypothetical protein